MLVVLHSTSGSMNKFSGDETALLRGDYVTPPIGYINENLTVEFVSKIPERK